MTTLIYNCIRVNPCVCIYGHVGDFIVGFWEKKAAVINYVCQRLNYIKKARSSPSTVGKVAACLYLLDVFVFSIAKKVSQYLHANVCDIFGCIENVCVSHNWEQCPVFVHHEE